MAKKVKTPAAPVTLWVTGYNTSTSCGSLCHVSHNDRLYASEEACQKAIDEMPPWLGMGSRLSYRPLPLEYQP